jgi:hypothetical protein
VDGSTVDLQTLLFNFTLDSATEFLFGHSVNFQLSPAGSEAAKFSAAFDRAQEHLQTRALVGRFRSLLRNRQFKDDCYFVHAFVDGYVAEMQNHLTLDHRKGNQDEQGGASVRYNLMGELADATNDPVQLRNELLNVLLAARDTTASLLSSTFFLLARNPRVWDRLQSEVAQLNARPPSYENTRDMRYVRAVLHESKPARGFYLSSTDCVSSSTVPTGSHQHSIRQNAYLASPWWRSGWLSPHVRRARNYSALLCLDNAPLDYHIWRRCRAFSPRALAR